MDYTNHVFLGDCYDILRQLPDNTWDACVSDVPYGLGDHEPTPEEIIYFLQGGALNTGGDFQGHDWEIPSVLVWKELYRVLKPGAHVVVFAGTKTFDLISMGARMAGFERRDTIAHNYPGLQWCQSQGMPKSRDPFKTDILPKVEEQLRAQGCGGVVWVEKADLVVVKTFEVEIAGLHFRILCYEDGSMSLPEEIFRLQYFGTGLKPTWEPIVVFRKPFEGTLAANALTYGTGVINIEATRVRHANKAGFNEHKKQVDQVKSKGGTRGNSWKNSSDLSGANDVKEAGRWPTNLVFTHHPECKHIGMVKVKAPMINRFDDGAKIFGGGAGHPYTQHQTGDGNGEEDIPVWECVEGCPIRELNLQKGPVNIGEAGKVSKYFPQFQDESVLPFFYTGKASKKESSLNNRIVNKHPTRKPVGLMRWLIRMVTPKGA